MVPYMAKGDRTKIVNDAFKDISGKEESPREKWERIQKRFANVSIEDGGIKRNKNSNRR